MYLAHPVSRVGCLSFSALNLSVELLDVVLSIEAIHVSHALYVVSFIFVLMTLAVTQNTPTFCNRLYHSSIVVNDKLYVDGGELRTV